MYRTAFSFRLAAGHVPEVLDRLVEIGCREAPLADRCSTFGYSEWTREAEARGLRPVYGVELGVSPDPAAKKQIIDYWTFFARDSLRPLNELIERATRSPGREPCLTYAQAQDHDLLAVTGPAVLADCLAPPCNNLWLGLSPASPRGSVRALAKLGHPFVARSQNFYPREGDALLWRTIDARASTQTYPQHILDDSALRAWLSAAHGDALAGSAMQNRAALLEASTARLTKASLLKPKRPKPLRALCRDGAKRLGIGLDDPTYRARLERELKLIAEKDFEDYFYIVADMMQFARSQMIVGPGRGSSCGSLVCYLLGITSVDPIPYGLLFERFIDVTRDDLPDIDVDLSQAKRDLVFDYMDEKYGSERTARLGSVNTLEAKGALALVSSAMAIARARTNELATAVAKRAVGDEGAGATLADALEHTATGRKFRADYPGAAAILPRLEWHPRAAGKHAAGIVLTDRPVTDTVAVNARSATTMCDKNDAEALNLLKIDVLGLTQLGIFERCLELAGLPVTNATLEAIPLDDPAAFDVFNTHRLSGIFQFGPSTTMARLVRQLGEAFARGDGGRIDSLDDLASLNAIVRPGPLASGIADLWIRRRAGLDSVTYAHPSLRHYLADTSGVTVYQEQLLEICREVGGLPWAEVTAIRRAMAKSQGGEAIDRHGQAWKRGAIARGLAPETADKVWADLCRFGHYAFNKSHSVAYAIVAYWCAWLKAHHPLAFAAATLDATADTAQQIEILRELDAEGVRYCAFDPERSEDRWTPKDGVLVGPLSNIRGIGPAAVRAILAARQDGPGWIESLQPAIRAKLEAATTPIDSLTPIQDAATRSRRYADIVSPQTAVADLKLGSHVMVIGEVTRLRLKDENDEASVARRGYRFSGETTALNVFLRDDSGEIFAKVGREHFPTLGQSVLEAGEGAIWAVKGVVPQGFRMISINAVKCLQRKGDPG